MIPDSPRYSDPTYLPNAEQGEPVGCVTCDEPLHDSEGWHLDWRWEMCDACIEDVQREVAIDNEVAAVMEMYREVTGARQ